MYKISLCDENKEKKNEIEGSMNTKLPHGAIIN